MFRSTHGPALILSYRRHVVRLIKKNRKRFSSFRVAADLVSLPREPELYPNIMLSKTTNNTIYSSTAYYVLLRTILRFLTGVVLAQIAICCIVYLELNS